MAPGTIKKASIDLLQDFMADLMTVFITAACLRAFTLTHATMEQAVDAVLKGELARFAKSGGAEAVAKWAASPKTGLNFSVPLVERAMRASHVRLSWSAPVFLAAVLELLLAKTLELAGLQRAARIKKHPRAAEPPTSISERDIFQALLADEGLRRLLLPLPLPAQEE